MVKKRFREYTHTHTHTRLTALCPGLPGWAGTRKVKPILILLKQKTVSGSGICWAICKSAPRFRQITMPVPHRSIFIIGRMPFLSPNQQCQSTEGNRFREYHNAKSVRNIIQPYESLITRAKSSKPRRIFQWDAVDTCPISGVIRLQNIWNGYLT